MGSINRIDFIGSAGVGKSTLYHELRKTRSKTEQWMTPQEVEIKIAQSESRKYPHSINNILRSRILNVCLPKKITYLLAKIILDNNRYKHLTLWEEREEIEAINILIAANASIPFPPSVKLKRMKTLFDFNYQISLFQKYAPDKTTIVYDDSLTNEITFLGPWNSDADKNNLFTYYSALGKFSAVIFLDAEDGIVIERLRKRMTRRINTAHYGMTNREIIADIKRRLYSARQVADMLEERGSVVFRINAGDPLAVQANRVRDALKQIT